MRTSRILDALFPAIRQKLLAAVLLSPEKWWYLSELASHLGTSPSSLQRELDSLTEGGVFERKHDGRRIYYKAQANSPVFNALRELLSKTAGPRKRNVIDYDHAFVATKTETEEIVAEAQAFFKLVENWIAAHHPKLMP